MTYGTWRPTLVLPASADAWTDDRRRAVLLHELAHVARRDCFVQRLASLACALYLAAPGRLVGGTAPAHGARAGVRRPGARGRRGAARVRWPPPRSRALTRRRCRRPRPPSAWRARGNWSTGSSRSSMRRATARRRAAADSPSRSPRRSPCSCRWRPCARPSCSSIGRPTPARRRRHPRKQTRNRGRPRGRARRISPVRGSSGRRPIRAPSRSVCEQAARRTAARCRAPNSRG